MICQTCRQARPGGSFWEGDTHYRSCKECRTAVVQIVERVDPYVRSIFATACQHPNSNIRVMALAGLTGDIAFVIQQLPVLPNADAR
jgi:hypothetical protein